MSVGQKLARPIINVLVERFFPNGLFFYGKGPLEAFYMVDAEKKTAIGGMAAIALVRHAHNSGATSLLVEMDQVTVNTDDLGDWIVRVERKP